MEAKFSISEVCSTSWQRLKSQIWVLAGLMIGIVIISIIVNVCTAFAHGSVVGSIIANLIGALVSGFLALGYIKNIFQALDGDEPQISAYRQEARKIITYFVANLLLGIITVVGLVLFIIPGIYLLLRLQFATAFIVEEDAGIMESLKRSWEITRGQEIPLFLLMLAMIGFLLLGLIVFIIGVFVAAPYVYMIYCYTFRKLNISLPIIEKEQPAE